ncbi:uncharacterized protein LOC112573377 isoform X3 [Pomacea canaliculata]|uniref:uncharacterized protein LOC112573377 isoform X3 n=1 Tax=Pomacea canaliculata TaxID=400727 RepID=UPI000D72ECD8|nr:uncharacterized protein LOC112573377 isoform X3 [Pomacea canaliculata]
MANSIMSSSSESSSLEQPPTVQYPKGQPPTDPYLKDQPPMDPPLTDFNPMRSSHSCPCVKDPPPIELPKDPLPIELPKDSHSSNESVVLQEEAETRDYFAYAVLSALFFLPVGIFAIVCSYQTMLACEKKDFEAATTYSRMTRMFMAASIICGIVTYILIGVYLPGGTS